MRYAVLAKCLHLESLGMLLGVLSMNIIGDLKSLRLFWTNLALNQRYSKWITESDINTFNDRLDHEGLSFLTVVLPKIGKSLDRYFALAEWVCPDEFKSSPWTLLPTPFNNADKIVVIEENLGTMIPIFMGSAIKAAIGGNSQAVDCVRQLSYAFYKLEVDFDEETVDSFLTKFEETDVELGQAINFDDVKVAELIADMKRIISRVLMNSDPRDIRPCHGSGATACRTENWDKWHKLRYYAKLDSFFPYSDYFFFSPTHLVDELDKLESSQESIPRARICLVPKDSRGPRIISCEPAELMYIQQGLMRLLYRTIESNYMTSGQINFTDQFINRDLARLASINDERCTIDLKDASDRVSLQLVRAVFPPVWVEALEACRSEETQYEGRVIKLNKFAPMGSSCCFPVEALVFWACAKAAIRRRYPRSRDDVYVYGDDIITESYLYETVVIGLERIGLKVNLDKSYVKGPFRESCGGDYHKGYEVTPIRIREVFHNHGTGLSTCADLCNNLVHKFGYEDALPLIRIIEEEVGYVYPRTELSLPNSIRTAPRASNDTFFGRRWNKNLQRYEYRILTLSSKALAKRAPSWGELLRKELSRDRETAGQYQHWSAKADVGLEPGSYTDVHSVRNKWTWTWLG
jgi:hypothetical protein